jgi:hypothetical protein
MNDSLRSALLVQRIDILRAKKEAFAQATLKHGQCEVRWIRLYGLVSLPSL